MFHEDQYIAVGRPLTLKCHAPDTSERVLWDYRRSPEHDVDNVYDWRLVNHYKQRCSINESTYDLTIHEVELGDTGEYWCIENAGYGTKHVTHLFATGTGT